MFRAFKRRHPLGFHLGWIRLAKILALVFLCFLFGPAQRPHVDGSAAAKRLLGNIVPRHRRIQGETRHGV